MLDTLKAKLISLFDLRGWCIVSSLYITGLCVKGYIKSISFDIQNFTHRTIGITVLDGHDVAKRTQTYILALIMAVLLFFVLSVLHDLLNRWLSKSPQRKKYDKYQDFIFDISVLGLFNLWWNISQNYKHTPMSSYIIFAVWLMGYWCLYGKRNSPENTFNKYFERCSYGIVIASAIPTSIILAYMVIFGKSIVISKLGISIYLTISTVLLFFYIAYIKWCVAKDKSPEQLISSVTIASVPLLLMPAFLALSNELQYMRSNLIYSGRSVFLATSAVLLIISVILFFKSFRKKSVCFNGYAVINNIVFPIITGTIILYIHYTPTLYKPLFDLFHDGEHLISAQQFFHFGAIPFIDFFPTHGFSDIITHFLYSFVNGYSFMDSYLWTWIIVVWWTVLFYFLFKVLLGPRKAFLICLFLPINFVFQYAYIQIAMPSLVCLWAFSSKYNTKQWIKYTVMWITVLSMFLWRIDFGTANFVTVIAIYSVIQINKLLNGVFELKDFLSFTKTGVVCFAAAFGVFCGLCILRSQSIGQVISLILRFMTFQAQSMGYGTMYNVFSQYVLSQYVIIPVLSLLCFIITLKIAIKNKKLHAEQIIISFINVFFLIMSIRSMQRGCLIVGMYPFGLVFLSSLFYLLLNPKSKEIAFGIFLTIVALNIFTIAPPIIEDSIVDRIKTLSKYGSQSKEFFVFNNWKNKESRSVIVDSQYKEAVEFLKQNLDEDQTFYEFGNVPTLYIAADKKMPAYFIPVFFNTSDMVQEDQVERLNKYLQEERLPYVIFRSNTGWDTVDLVYNEIRCPKIAEFIYDNYSPYGTVNGFYFWIYNTKKISDTDTDTTLLVPQEKFKQYHQLKRLPYIWGEFDEKRASETTPVLQKLTTVTLNVVPGQIAILPMQPDYDKSTGSYLHFRISAVNDAVITVTYNNEACDVLSGVTFDILCSKHPLDYLVRMSSQWEWVSKPINIVTITTTLPITIEEVYLRKGD